MPTIPILQLPLYKIWQHTHFQNTHTFICTINTAMQSGQIILGMKQPAKLTAFAKMATLLVHFIGVKKG